MVADGIQFVTLNHLLSHATYHLCHQRRIQRSTFGGKSRKYPNIWKHSDIACHWACWLKRSIREYKFYIWSVILRLPACPWIRPCISQRFGIRYSCYSHLMWATPIYINVVIGWLLKYKCLFLVPVQRPKSVQTLSPAHLNMCCEYIDNLKQ